MDCTCKGHKKGKCGEFSKNENKDAKLKHLKECKIELMGKIQEIDKAIADLEK